MKLNKVRLTIRPEKIYHINLGQASWNWITALDPWKRNRKTDFKLGVPEIHTETKGRRLGPKPDVFSQ